MRCCTLSLLLLCSPCPAGYGHEGGRAGESIGVLLLDQALVQLCHC